MSKNPSKSKKNAVSADTDTAPLSTLLVGGLDVNTQKRIELAVLDVFSSREFHHVSLIEIARSANVSLQTIYKYYGSKERLLFASLDSWFNLMIARVMDHLQAIETFKDKLRKVVWLVLDFFEKNPKVAQLILSSVYMNTWRKEETFKQRSLMSLMLLLFKEGQMRGELVTDADEVMLMDFFYGALSRTVVMWQFRGQKESLVDKSGILFDLIWRAICKGE